MQSTKKHSLTHFRVEHTILGRLTAQDVDQIGPIRIESEGLGTVTANFIESGRALSVEATLPLAQEVALEIADYATEVSRTKRVHPASYQKLSSETRESIEKISRGFAAASRRVLSLIRQEFLELGLLSSLFSTRGLRWSEDGVRWQQAPFLIMSSVRLVQSGLLNPSSVSHLQALLDSNERPLLAFEHLAQAVSSASPASAWIEATIALELGIKEALVRAKPDLELVLNELPAPPLHKLYGSIMEDVVGRPSPFKKEVAKGAEIRNRLVHRPTRDVPPAQEVNDYLGLVESALCDLISAIREREGRPSHFLLAARPDANE